MNLRVRAVFIFVVFFVGFVKLGQSYGVESMEKINKSNEEWKKELSPEEYHVCRLGATERPFSGKYVNNHEKGMYKCTACGNILFDSETKFDSGTGWPSFWKPADNKNLEAKQDTSHGMDRTEVICSRCGAHLGHVFPDGPKPTGLRYCINSTSLKFEKDEQKK